MDFQYGWLLNLICFLPLAGALLIMLFVNKENSSGIKAMATVVAGLDFVISIPLWFLYRPDGAEFQFASQADWIPSVGVQYLFGVDGFQFPVGSPGVIRITHLLILHNHRVIGFRPMRQSK